MKEVLPRNYEELFLLTVFLQNPHIIASIITFADKEYISGYGLKFILGLLLIPVVLVIASKYLSFYFFNLFFIFFTVYHALSQQFGLSRSFAKINSLFFIPWFFSGFVLGLTVYLDNFGFIEHHFWQNNFSIIYKIEIIVFSLFSALVVYKSDGKFGKFYAAGNVVLLISGYYFFVSSYPFFVIFIPRLIHDVTAYFFYVPHDKNKEEKIPGSNLLFNILKFTRLPIPILTLLISIFIGAFFGFFEKFYIVNISMISLTFWHYFYESFCWKRSGLHRQYIRFS